MSLFYYQGCSYQHDGRWTWVRRSLGGIWQRRPVTPGWREWTKPKGGKT